MDQFREFFLIALSTPIYLVVIAFEIIFSRVHNKGYYTTKGTFYNFYLTTLNMGLDILLRGVCLFVLDYFFKHRFIEIAHPVAYWVTLLIAQDFLYYLLHVTDHYCRLFWAVHVTHHSSEEFNLTVGFRSSVLQPVYRFVFFIPLALAGFKGMDIMFMYSATQIYGILVHTQSIGKLGLLEYIFVTPSHHRVHHGSNPKYHDRNMGMFLIIWDRLFGTFQEETEPVKFGLTANISNVNPVNVVFHEWKSIFEDIRKPIPIKDKLKYIFYKPGWSHDGSRLTSNQLRNLESLLENNPSQPSNLVSERPFSSNTA